MLASCGQSTTDSENSVKCNEVLNIEKMEHNCEVNVSDKVSNLPVFKIEDNFGLTVLVGNLTNNVTSELLKNFLVNEGSLQNSDISRIGEVWKFVKENDTYGVTLVEFSSDTAFQIALTLNNKEFNGKSIIIVPAVLSHQGLISLYASCPSMNITDTANEEKCEVMDIDNDDANVSKIKNIPSNVKEEANTDNTSVKKEIVIDAKDGKKHTTEKLGDIQLNENFSISTGNDEKDILENNEKDINSTAVSKNTVAVTNINNNFQTGEEKNDVTLPPSKCDSITVVEDVGNEGTFVNNMEGKPSEISEQVSFTPTELNTSSVKQDEASSKTQIETEQNKYVAMIKNLPPNTKEDDLMKFFNITRESILETSFMKNMRRRSEHTLRAIVSFISEECLKQCLDKTKMYFYGRQIFVERYDKSFIANVGVKRQNKTLRASTDHPLMSLTDVQFKTPKNQMHLNDKIELDLFIKHLPRDVSDRQLIDFFSSTGAVITNIYRFPDPIKDRGMAFVSMKDRDSLIKGLAMNCKIISGIKIRVSIRSDRRDLVPPVKDEELSNFSTFIGKLPSKQSADELKLSLKNFFEMSGCSINFINVPHALNHSGNRGYAFIIFEDEESLLKCQKFHKTEILLNNSKVIVDISKQWPEIRLGPPIVGREKAREMTYSQEDLLRGKQNKRRRKGNTPTRTLWDGKSKDSYKFFPNPLYQQDPCNYPSEQHSSLRSNSSCNVDYKSYHDYWDRSDYLNERNKFSSLESRGSNRHEDFRSQSMEMYLSSSHTQGSSLSLPNQGIENGVAETSSYSSRDYRDRMNYDEIQPSISSGSCKWRDGPEYRITSQQSSSTDPDCISFSSMKMASSGLSSADNLQYNSSSSSYKLRNPFYSERETVPSFSKPFSSQDGNERRNSLGSLSSDYYQPMRETDYGSSSSIPACSNLRSINAVPSSRTQSDVLFTRLDRRPLPFGGNDYSGYTGANDRVQKSSYSSVSSNNRYSGEITRYGHHLLQADEKRQTATYGKPSSFVNKLASSGILSNAGYDTYPGVGGYRAN